MEARKVLTDAADLLRRHGWCRSFMTNSRGQMCVRGAIEAATPGDLILTSSSPRQQAFAMLKALLPADKGLMHWNDHVCATPQQAIDLLLRAASRNRFES